MPAYLTYTFRPGMNMGDFHRARPVPEIILAEDREALECKINRYNKDLNGIDNAFELPSAISESGEIIELPNSYEEIRKAMRFFGVDYPKSFYIVEAGNMAALCLDKRDEEHMPKLFDEIYSTYVKG